MKFLKYITEYHGNILDTALSFLWDHFAPRYRVDYFGYPFPRLWRFTNMWYQYLIIKLEPCNTNKFDIYDINAKIFFNFERLHDDVIKWKQFPCYWPFVRGIHRSPVNSLHKGQWRWALMFSLICARMNGWVNSGEAGDLRRHRVHYDVIVMRIIFYHDTLIVYFLIRAYLLFPGWLSKSEPVSHCGDRWLIWTQYVHAEQTTGYKGYMHITTPMIHWFLS